MKSWVTLVTGVVFVSTVACAPSASGQPSTSDSSVSQDEMAVYEAVLTSWLDKEQRRQLVDRQLSPPPSKADPEFSECAAGLHFSQQTTDPQERKSLAGVQFKRKGIELIDGSQWKPRDPGQGIANGESVDAAVREGFANSLISFSQIAFSRDGKDALVKFGMACGSLCGSGATMHLHKAAKGWAIVNRCGNWES